ncbi:hypothetical protein KQI84_01845 [bacterium]|nr:hypothetical protein [bacterium]
MHRSFLRSPLLLIIGFTILGLTSRVPAATLDISDGTGIFVADDGESNALTLDFYILSDAYELHDANNIIVLTGNRLAGTSGSGTNTVTVPNQNVGMFLFLLGDMADGLEVKGTDDYISAFGGPGGDLIVFHKVDETGASADGEDGDDTVTVVACEDFCVAPCDLDCGNVEVTDSGSDTNDALYCLGSANNDIFDMQGDAVFASTAGGIQRTIGFSATIDIPNVNAQDGNDSITLRAGKGYVRGGADDDQIHVMGSDDVFDINGESGTDIITVDLGDLGGRVIVNDFQDGSSFNELFVNGTEGRDVLNVLNYQMTTATDQIDFTTGAFVGIEINTRGGDDDILLLDRMNTGVLKCGSGDDYVQTYSATSGGGYYQDGEDGSDTYLFYFDPDPPSVVYQEQVEDTGTGATDVDRMTVEGTSGVESILIKEHASYFGFKRFYYYGVEELTLDLLEGDDTVSVERLASNELIRVSGGDDNDSFEFGTTLLPLTTLIAGSMILTGGYGEDSLVVNDSGSTFGRTVNLSTNFIKGMNLAPLGIMYSGFESGAITLGSGEDGVSVVGNGAPFTIETGAGNDLVSIDQVTTDVLVNLGPDDDRIGVGTSGDLTQIAGDLRVIGDGGVDLLAVSDSIAVTSKTGTLEARRVTGLGTYSGIVHEGFEYISVDLGTKGDQFDIYSIPTVIASIRGGEGDDIIQQLADQQPVVGQWAFDAPDDIGIAQNGRWWIDWGQNGSIDPNTREDGQAYAFFLGPQTPVVGDWNGDSIDDIGVFDPDSGVWLLDLNGNLQIDDTPLVAGVFGTGVTPIVGDWNGDDHDDLGAHDRLGENFYLDLNGDGVIDLLGTEPPIPFGTGSGGRDFPLVGDFNGDGFDDIAAFDPQTANWAVDFNGNLIGDEFITTFATNSGDGGVPLIGDWDGVGGDEIGIYEPYTGLWRLDADDSGTYQVGTDTVVYYTAGTTLEQPVVGDWNDDGTDDVGVFAPETGEFLRDRNANYIADDLFDTPNAVGIAEIRGDGGEDLACAFSNTPFIANGGTQASGDVLQVDIEGTLPTFRQTTVSIPGKPNGSYEQTEVVLPIDPGPTIFFEGTSIDDLISLEDGFLKIADVSIKYIDATSLQVDGDDGSDHLEIRMPHVPFDVDFTDTGGTGTNTLEMNGQVGTDVWHLAGNTLTIDGLTVTFSGDTDGLFVNGLDGDDTVTVEGGSSSTEVFLHGGPEPLADTFNFDGLGLGGTNNPSGPESGMVQANGYRPVHYEEFEALNITNFLAPTPTPTPTPGPYVGWSLR